MAKKEDTPIRRARRNYEARNKEEREQSEGAARRDLCLSQKEQDN